MAFDTNIAKQTVEYQNLDRLVLESGHVLLITDEGIDVWTKAQLEADGYDPQYSIRYKEPWEVRAEQRLADKKAGRFYTSEED